MREVVRKAFHEFSAPLEGKEVPFMYLDSADPVGFVTIATGCLIDPLQMATSLPFIHPSGRPATMTEIVECWNLVKGRQDLKKHGGMVFGGLSGNTLRLTPSATRALVDKRLAWFDVELEHRFPEWAWWPACAQLFGLSWAWAVGVHAKYPKMIDALQRRDFAEAALECTINPPRGTIRTRNQWNRNLLQNADRVQAYRLDYDLLTWDVVIGVSDVPTLPELPLLNTPLPDSRIPPVTNSASLPTIAPQPILRADPSAYMRPKEFLQGADLDDPDDDDAA